MSRPKLYSSATKYHLGYHPECRWWTTVGQDLPGLKSSGIVNHCSEPGVKMIITLRHYEIFYTGIINRGKITGDNWSHCRKDKNFDGSMLFFHVKTRVICGFVFQNFILFTRIL